MNERYLATFIASLDALHTLLIVLTGRIEYVLSPAAIAAHNLPAPFEAERQYIMKACLYTLQLGWSSLSLPVYLDLQRRIEGLKVGTLDTAVERRREQERFETLLEQVYQMTLRGARIVARCVHDAPSLAFLTHLQQERVEIWVPILMEARVVENGGEGITRREKITELGWFARFLFVLLAPSLCLCPPTLCHILIRSASFRLLDGLKLIGWSWPDSTHLIDTLESNLQALQLEDILSGPGTDNPSINFITRLSPLLASSSDSPANSTILIPNSAPMTPSALITSSELGMGILMRSRGNSSSNMNGMPPQLMDYSSYFPPISPGLSSFPHHHNHHVANAISSARNDMSNGGAGTPTGGMLNAITSHPFLPLTFPCELIGFDFDALLGSGYVRTPQEMEYIAGSGINRGDMNSFF